MPKLKYIKSFVHNLADSYMSTLGWVEGDYKSTWVYRSALESGVNEIYFDIRNYEISPSTLIHRTVLQKSLEGLNEHFDKMLKTQNIEPSFVPSITFKFEIPKLSESMLHIVCIATAVDTTGKEHIAA
ncbi:hypothetical protein Q4Q49_21965, partial [Shewanella sp. SP1S1-7]|uniref:hypothetical protein n=2 Tax=unclassified Shewanella TaxID=196818 RepID=UPI00288EA63B